MTDAADPLVTERLFFDSLKTGDTQTLNEVLADDFMLIDVMAGSEITKAALLGVLGSGQLKFEVIEPVEARVRRYDATAVVTGCTRMSGRFGETPFAVRSRYTHIYVERQKHWRLVAAQGTQIVGE